MKNNKYKNRRGMVTPIISLVLALIMVLSTLTPAFASESELFTSEGADTLTEQIEVISAEDEGELYVESDEAVSYGVAEEQTGNSDEYFEEAAEEVAEEEFVTGEETEEYIEAEEIEAEELETEEITAEELEADVEEENAEERYERILSDITITEDIPANLSHLAESQIGRAGIWDASFLYRLMVLAGVEDAEAYGDIDHWYEELRNAEVFAKEAPKATDIVFFRTEEDGRIVRRAGIYTEANFIEEQFENDEEPLKRFERGLFFVISGDAEGTVVEAEYTLVNDTFTNVDGEIEHFEVRSAALKEETEGAATEPEGSGGDPAEILFLSESEAILDGVYPVPVPVTEEPVKASEEAYEALAASDLSSLRLIVGTADPALLEEEAGLVASYNDMYLLQFESIEAVEKAFLRYYDAADFVTPDTGIAAADDEDLTDPEEAAITTDTVYTEEDNPFTAAESALESEGAGAPKSDVRRIALIDTGAEVSDNVVEAVSVIGGDYRDDNGHGERMVGYILEENPNAEIISIKALGTDGTGDISAVIAGMNYAIERGVQIINLSLSAYASEENAALTDAVRRAAEAGIIVVGAAGNQGFNAKYYIPGSIDEAIIVGAADKSGEKIDASNFGETVDFNVVAETTSEAAAKLTGFISAKGADAIKGALNAGLIFVTDYVAPVEVEEEETDEVKELEDKEEDKAESFEGVRAQADNGTITSWEKLAQAIGNVPTGSSATIFLNSDMIAATTAATPNGTITIDGNRNITIVAESEKKIYRNAAGNDTNFTMFKVAEGSVLTIGNNVTLTGKQATLTSSTSTTTISDGSSLQIKSGNDVLYIVSGGALRLGNPASDSAYVQNSDQWKLVAVPDGSGKFYIQNKGTGQYIYGARAATFTGQYYGSQRITKRQMYLTDNPAASGIRSKFVVSNNVVYLEGENGNETLGYDGPNRAVYGVYPPQGVTNINLSQMTITVVSEAVVEEANQALYWKQSGNASGNEPRKTFTGTEDSAKAANRELGFFVTVKAGGTLNIEGSAEFRDFNTVLYRDNVPQGVAPIYSEGTINMSGGTIRDNRVSYTVRNANNSGPADITDYIDYRTMLDKITAMSGVGWPENAYQVADRATNKRDQMSAGAIRAESGTVNITGGSILDNMSHAGAIALGVKNNEYSAETTLNMSGGVIDGNLASNNGIVFVTGGTRFNMTGGSIGLGKGETRPDGTDGTGNRTLWGGGVLVASNANRAQSGNGLTDMHEAVFVLNGGKIKGNENRSQGGGIMVHSNSVNLVKGEIGENISHVMGGGIYVYGLDNPNGSAPYVSFTLLIDRAGIYDNLATYSGNSANSRNKGQGSSVLDQYYYSSYQSSANGVVYSPSDLTAGGDINRFTAGSGGGLWLCPQGAIEVDTQTVHIVNNDADVHGDDLFKDNGFGGGIVLGIDNDPLNHKNWYHDWALREGVGTVSGGVGTGEVRQYPVNYYDYWMLNMNTAGAGAAGSLLPSEIRAISSDNQQGTNSFNPRDVFQKDEGKLTAVESSYGYNGALALTNHYDRAGICNDYDTQNVRIYNNISRRGGGIGADGQLMFIDRTQNAEREINEAYVDFEKTFDTETVAEDKMKYIVSFRDENFMVENNKVYEKKITADNQTTWIERTDLQISGNEIIPTGNTSGGELESQLTVSNGAVYRQHADFRLYDATWGKNNNDALGTGLEFEPNVYILATGNNNSDYKKARITIPVSALRVKNKSNGDIESILDGNNKFRTGLFDGDGSLNSGYEWATEMLIKEYRIVSESGSGLLTEEVKDNIFHLGDIRFTKKETTIRENTFYGSNGQTEADGSDVIVEYTFKLTMNNLFFDMKATNKDTSVEKYINGKVHEDYTAFDQVFEYSIMAYVPEDAEEIVITDTLEDPLMFVDRRNPPQPQYTESGTNGAFYVVELLKNSSAISYDLLIVEENDHKGDGTGSVKTAPTDARYHLNGPLVTKRSSSDPNKPVQGSPNSVTDSFFQTGTIGADGTFTPNKFGNTIRVQITNDMLKGTYPGYDVNQNQVDAHGKWIRLTFKAAIKPAYRDIDKLKAVGWITDTESKQGTSALPEYAEDLNAYMNYVNSQNKTNASSTAADATNDRIVRIIRTNVDGQERYFAKTEKGQYFQKNVDGDGFWYKTTLHPENSSYTGLWKVTPQGLNDALPVGGQNEKDGTGKTLLGNNRTVGLFSTDPHEGEVYLYPTTAGTNWPVVDGADTHENINGVQEQHHGVKNQADYKVKTQNGGEYTYKTNIVTFEPRVSNISITKALSGSGTTYPANGFTFNVNLSEVDRSVDPAVTTPVNGTFKLEYKDMNGTVVTSAVSGGTTITFPSTVTFTNGKAVINVLPEYTATIKGISYTKTALTYEVTEDKSAEGTEVGGRAHVGDGTTFSAYETYFSNSTGEISGSDTAGVICTNKPTTDFSHQTDYKFEHKKTIDYLGDGQNSTDNGNPDTTIDDEGTAEELKDLYRLTLDITGKRKGVDLLLVVDRSYSMAKYGLDGKAPSETNTARSTILLDYLYGTASDPNSSFINSFLDLNKENEIAICWFGGRSNRGIYQRDYGTITDTVDGATYTYKNADVALDWTSSKVTYNHSSRTELTPVNGTATDYMSGYWKALELLEAKSDNGRQKVVVFLSDGSPTLYIGTDSLYDVTPNNPLAYWNWDSSQNKYVVRWEQPGYHDGSQVWDDGNVGLQLRSDAVPYYDADTRGYSYTTTTPSTLSRYYYHVLNNEPMTYKELRDYFANAQLAKYSNYKDYRDNNTTIYQYGTGSDTNLSEFALTNIAHDLIKEKVSVALDDFMWTINGKEGDASYPGIDGLKGNTSFFSISYGVELNNAGVDARDNALMDKFAVSNGSKAFSVKTRQELDDALTRAIQVFPNDVTVVDQLSKYVNLYKDDLKEAEAKIIMNDAETHEKIVVCEASGYDPQTGKATLTHYVKYIENPTTRVQTLIYLKDGIWKYADNNAVSQADLNSGNVHPIVESINYEKTSNPNLPQTGQVTAEFDGGYKMVPEYAYALSFNVKLTETAYMDYMDEDKTYLPSSTAPAGVEGDALDAITYYRKTEGANYIFVSKKRYDEELSAEEKEKFVKDGSGNPIPFYYTQSVDTSAYDYKYVMQVGEDPTDYTAYSDSGTYLYDNGTSTLALGFQSNHEAWVVYTVNGSDYLTDYYDRPVVQVRPRGSLIIGKVNTSSEPINHDAPEKTVTFQLLASTAPHDVLYVSKPVEGNNNRYVFVKDENKNKAADENETDKLIDPGTYLLHEVSAPENHVAGENTPITISYNTKGYLQVSFPSGSRVSAGYSGAIIDPETGLVVTTATITPGNEDEQDEAARDFNLQNLELKNFEFGKTDKDNNPLNHADNDTLATFELLQNSDGSTSVLKPGAEAKYRSVAIGGTASNRYTFVPVDTPDSEINTPAKAEAYAKAHGIAAGTYWLKETSSPTNYLAGEPVKLVVSYGEGGQLVVSFPNGSPVAFGESGAVLDGKSGAAVGAGYTTFDTLESSYITGEGANCIENLSNGDKTVTAYSLFNQILPGNSNFSAVGNASFAQIRSAMYTAYHNATDEEMLTLVDQLKAVLYHGYGQPGYETIRGQVSALSGADNLVDEDIRIATQMAVFDVNWDYIEAFANASGAMGGLPSKAALFDYYLESGEGISDSARKNLIKSVYNLIIARKDETPENVLLDLFTYVVTGLPATGDITGQQLIGLRAPKSFNVQNKKNGVPLNIRKVNGDQNDAPISYVKEYQVIKSDWGGLYLYVEDDPDGKPFYYLGGSESALADRIHDENGTKVIYSSEVPVVSKEKTQNMHISGNWNYGIYRETVEADMAKFYLVPEMVEYRVVKNSGSGMWIVVERENVEKGITLGGRIPEGYDRQGHAYYWIGELGSQVTTVTHTETGKILVNPTRGDGVNSNNEIYRDGINVDQHYTGGSYTPSNLIDYGYYWGPNPTVDMLQPAYTQQAVLDYINSTTDAEKRAYGVYESVSTTAGASNAIYDFVKVGSAAGTTDLEDINVREGVYWLVETNSPDGFFASARPVRIKVEADPTDSTKAKVTYAGDTDTNSPEYRAFDYYVDRNGNNIENGTTDGLAFDMSFRNYELYALPSAGGPGTYLFTIFGTMMLTLAFGFGLMMLRRQREVMNAKILEKRNAVK